MSDVNDMLKAELGVKSDKYEHHHHHDKKIVPTAEATIDINDELQSQLGQGKQIDEKKQHEIQDK